MHHGSFLNVNEDTLQDFRRHELLVLMPMNPNKPAAVESARRDQMAKEAGKTLFIITRKVKSFRLCV